MENPEFTLSEYWRIIRKRKELICGVFTLVVISSFIFTKMQTPVYEASLELRIDRQQPPVVAPGAAAVDLSGFGALNLATEIRMIQSLPVLEKVIEKMEVLPTDPEERQQAIYNLSLSYQQRLAVEQIKDTNIVTIRTQSSDPEKAALMATAIADVYIVENVEGRKRQSRAVIEYINKQAEEYKAQLAEMENKFQKFKQNEKVFEVTPAIKETLDRMTIQGSFEFETEMQRIDDELKALNAEYDQSPLKETVDRLLSTALADNYIFIGLKRRLLELEFERFLLLIDYTEEHPAVAAQDRVIAEAKSKIVHILKSYSNAPQDPQLETNLAAAIKKLFLENRKEVLFRIVNKFYEDTGSLSSNQIEYLGLKRNIERVVNAYDALLKQRDEVNLSLAKVIDDVVTIVSPATPPSRPVKPNVRVSLAISIVVGILLGIMIGFIYESMDSSVGTIHDVEHELKLSILGIIPHIGPEYIPTDKINELDEVDKKIYMQRARLITVTNPKSWPAESIKMLRSNIVQIMKTRGVKKILFTSSDMQEGKSTTVANLAISMAQLGKKTVLVGANMRRPSIERTFGIERTPGLSDVLMGNTTWEQAINTSTDILIGGSNVDDLLAMPGIDNLKILASGRPVDNVSELLNSRTFDQLLADLAVQFDVVLIDCSPVMAVPDAVTICDRVDGVVLIYKVGQTSKDVLKMAKSHIANAKGNILGIVLNDIKTEAQVGYAAFSYRYYGEKKDNKESLIEKWKNQFNKEFKPKDNVKV